MHAKIGVVHRFEKMVRGPGLRQGIIGLSVHRLFMQMGIGIFGVFAPIYFYHVYHQRLDFLVISVIIQYGLDFFLTPLGAKFMTRWGINRSMILGTVCLMIYFSLFVFRSFLPLWLFIVGTMLIGCAYHVLYWLPFHIEFVYVTPGKQRGEILGMLSAIGSLVGVVAPVLGGYLIVTAGYGVLTMIAFCCIALALPSLHWVKAAQEKYTFTYAKTLRVLFSKPYRLFLMVYLAEGAESVVGIILWPIFLYQLTKGDYMSVGFSSGLIVGTTIILELLVGYLSDHRKGSRLLKTGVGLSSLGWMIKALVTTLSQAVMAGIFHSFSLILMRVPFQTRMYALAADAGHYIDEYTVLREMALCLGRVVMLTVCLIFMGLFGFTSAFVLAGIATIGFGYIIRLPFEKLLIKQLI